MLGEVTGLTASANESQLRTFAHNITWLRKHFGISKKRMAALLGVSAATIRRLECGEVPPRMGVEVLFRVYKEFGLKPSDQCQHKLG